jgi:retron-type reverse transcriptase
MDRNLYKYMTNPDFLYMGYRRGSSGSRNKAYNIKSKPVAAERRYMTKGVYPETINYQFFIDLSDKLKDESRRRILISKTSKGYRPLTIGAPRDKIVQECA